MTSNHTSIPGPHNIRTATLENGLRVLVYENFASETVVIDGYLCGGSIGEEPKQAGIASMTSSMLRRGTAKHSYDEINDLVDSTGISFGFGAGRHVLSLDGKAMQEDIDLLLELLTESLSQPAFEPNQLEQVRARVLTSIQERNYNTRATAALVFREHIFPANHPYGRPLSGSEPSVSGITAESIEAFYRRFIGPDKGILVLAGAINADVALQKLSNTFALWQMPEARPELGIPHAPVLGDKIAVNREIPGKSQSDIVLGWPGIDRQHPDYFPLLLCNSILGRFGMGGRLGYNVRELQGMAYYAYSSFGANKGADTWYAYAGVNPANVSKTIETMLHEIRRICNEEVEDHELADVKANLSGSLPLYLETNGGIAANLLNMAWYDLGIDYLMRYAERVHAVSKEDIMRVAQTYLDSERYVLAVAGPPTS